jgi:hypothetical protein
VKLNIYNPKTVNSIICQRQAADLENRASNKHIKINTNMETTPSISKPHILTPHMLNLNKIKIPKHKKNLQIGILLFAKHHPIRPIMTLCDPL